jgi:hypothetical protein
MKPSRSFRPSAPFALESRVVPSAMAAHAATVRPVTLSAAEIAQSNASDTPFGLSPSDTLRAGQSVAEQVTTTYSTGSPQTESLLKVPDLPNNSVTAYKTINLRNDGGTETVVDTETYSGGTIPLSGTHNTHTVTTTLPDGSTETETENEVIEGHKTIINATIHEANGGVETWTSSSIKTGPKTVANSTITEPDGTIKHRKTVTIDRGDLDSTADSTTTLPGQIQVSPTATNVIRIQPPSS